MIAASRELTTDDFREFLKGLDVAFAAANPQSWEILFENERFFQWFAPAGERDDNLATRVGTLLDESRARARLAEKRPFTTQGEIRSGARTTALGLTLRLASVGDREFLLLQAQNISKQKEAEYMLDSYSRMAEKNTRELQREKERVEKLLLNIMPRSVYEEMKQFGTTTPQRFDAATVLMLDFVGSTEMAVSRDPSSFVGELNDIFSAFDRIVEMFGCERIKTIGDAYLAVSGLPESTPDHASNVARVALRMRHYLNRRNASHTNQWRCRIGIATGPVVGSLVGIHKYVYDIFGPAVNLAARLEMVCEPMQILTSDATYELISDGFFLSERGACQLKGFGEVRLYALEDEQQSLRP